MITTVESSGAMLNSHPLKKTGRFESSTSRSLENLLSIRPRGVVSKKDMGA